MESVHNEGDTALFHIFSGHSGETLGHTGGEAADEHHAAHAPLAPQPASSPTNIQVSDSLPLAVFCR